MWYFFRFVAKIVTFVVLFLHIHVVGLFFTFFVDFYICDQIFHIMWEVVHDLWYFFTFDGLTHVHLDVSGSTNRLLHSE